MFGEDAYEAELRRRVVELGIASQVEFLGFRSDVPAVLRTLDILVHASTSADPCPNTVLEGMAEGLAVIGSDGGGVPEMIVEGETGLLAPMGDAEGLARAIESLLVDPARAQRMGQAGFVRVRQEFTAARVARQVEEIYERIQTHRA
jgi:glycosyltransferase involved in cell wall biosynthesis